MRKARARTPGIPGLGSPVCKAAMVVAAVVLACCARSSALDPSLDISQYAHTAWKYEEGFAKGTIHQIAQTPDGYLWLGTEFGLYRFDGVRAVLWLPPGGQQLPDTYIRSLLAARDGTLWIGTYGGLASFRDGKLTKYPQLAGQEVGTLLEDREGTIWAGTGYQTVVGKLYAIRDNNVRLYGEDSFGNAVYSLYEDSAGNLWVGAVNGLWRWKPGPPKFYPTPDRVLSLGEAENGALLLIMRDGIKQLVDGRVEAYPLPGSGLLELLFRDRDGNLWIGMQHGLLHTHKGKRDSFEKSDGLSGEVISAVFEDREGNIWVATDNGLDRFRKPAVIPLSAKQGFVDIDRTASVQTARDGSIWLSNFDHLTRWKQGQITTYSRGRKGSGHGPEGIANGMPVREIVDSALADEIVGSLFEDHRGRIWASTIPRVVYFENDHFVPLNSTAPCKFVHSLAEDSAGDVWISAHEFLCDVRNGSVVEQIPWARLGMNDFAETLIADPVRGGVWLGFFKGGVAYFRGGQIRASYTSLNGLGNGRVNSLRLGGDGVVWAATVGGLSRIQDGRVTTLTRKNGLPCDSLDWAIEDNAHSFWLNMACGLVRITQTELDSWVADSTRTVQVTVFDSSDGVKSHAFFISTTPHVAKSSDGKLWFSTWNGLSVVDPQHLPTNRLAPPVHVEQITADGKSYAPSDRKDLPPLVRDVAIDYTALSFVAPEKVRFRFKLEGQDPKWREVVNDRQVQYSNLAPGKYTFRVIACNNSGVWNEQGDMLEFSVAPAYYQTNWFRALCGVVLLALLWGAYRFRVHELREQEAKFREAVETMPNLAFIARPDGYRTFVNRGWVEYTGLTVEQASGIGWRAAVHPDDLQRVLDKWKSSVAASEPLEYELRLRRRADGAYRWFLTRAVPVRDNRGRIVKWCGTATDIEDRRRAEQLQADLAHTNRVSMLGELAASIAHELKQPITATMTTARTSLRWLDRDEPDLDKVRQGAERIVKDGARATEIIDRLRSLYKKTPPRRELVDINEIIGEMVLLLRGEAHRYAVSIRTDLPAGLPRIMADRVQLQQVLMNLILNGIEAMKETGGVLTLKSQPENGCVLISVSDTGVGLPAEKADRIFDAFFTTKPQGSGMGLAISRSIVESHAGRLWATSNNRRGASFHLTLPTAIETATEAPAVEM